jgi:hypothetical protein
MTTADQILNAVGLEPPGNNWTPEYRTATWWSCLAGQWSSQAW